MLTFYSLLIFLRINGLMFSRVTRMNVVEYFENLVHGDGIRIDWGHKTNTWKQLLMHKNDPSVNNSVLLEGDVYLERHPKSIPVMVKPEEEETSLPFKNWIKEAAITKKALRISFMTTEVVKPALRYLFSTKEYLQSPIVLHADVVKMTKDSTGKPNFTEIPVILEEKTNFSLLPVDSRKFIGSVNELFPDATLSVGWTNPPNKSGTGLQLSYNWRNVFDMLDRVHSGQMSLVFSVHAPYLRGNYPQMSWLLGIKESISLHIWSINTDPIDDWQTLAQLRRWQDHSRILYDLPNHHKQQIVARAASVDENRPKSAWKSEEWEVIQFTAATSMLSTVIKSRVAPAFLGWPAAFLMSLKRPSADRFQTQILTGQVLFVPKPSLKEINPHEETGLSIYLLDSVDDIPSPSIRSGIHIFIGFDGNLFIENRNINKGTSLPLGSRSHFWPSVLRSHSIVDESSCYSFEISDSGSAVDLYVESWICVGQFDSDGVESRPNSWRRSLRLDTKASTNGQRYIIVQKTGDGAVDCIVHNLQHSFASSLEYHLYILLFAAFLSLFSNFSFSDLP